MKVLVDIYRENEFFFYENVNWIRVIATKAYDFSVKNYIKEALRFFFFSYLEKEERQGDGVRVFVYSYRGRKRKDYDEIADHYCEIDNKSDVIEYRFCFSFKKIFRKLRWFFLLYRKYKKKEIKHPAFFSLLIAQYVVYFREISKKIMERKYRVVTTFCDTHDIENLFSQIAKSYNKTTVTLQHGQYVFWNREIPESEVYKNFVSDYLLAWGRATKEEFKKAGVNENKILCVGALKEFSKNTPLVYNNMKNVFGVILSGNVHKKSNIHLIELANGISKKYKLKYILRLHPQNSECIYKKECDLKYLYRIVKGVENIDYVKQVDFSLVYMTGVFVELLSLNSAILIYEDENLKDLFKLNGFCFSDIKGFEKIYGNFCIRKKEFLKEQYHYYSYFNERKNIKRNYIYAIQKILEIGLD